MVNKNENWLKVVWRMLYPLLVYEGIGLLMQIIFAVGVSVHAMLGTDLASVLGDEQGYYQFMNTILESFYSKMYYCLIAGAVVTIPLLCLFVRKDREKRQANGIQPIHIQVPALVYPLVAVTAFGACIGGNNLILSSGLMEVDETYQQLTQLLYSAPLWFQLMGTGVIVPLCEELIFRGLIYNRLKESVSVRWALPMSALAFGIGHGNLVQGIYAFALGYLMAYLYEKTGKMWVPILFHIVANMLSVLITETVIFNVLYLNEITVLLSGAAGVLVAMGGMMLIQKQLPEMVQENIHRAEW